MAIIKHFYAWSVLNLTTHKDSSRQAWRKSSFRKLVPAVLLKVCSRFIQKLPNQFWWEFHYQIIECPLAKCGTYERLFYK